MTHPVLTAIDAGHVATWAQLHPDEPQRAMQCRLDSERWPCTAIATARTHIRARTLADRGTSHAPILGQQLDTNRQPA